MSGKTYLVISILFAVISLIGLVSLIGGIRIVNVGAFVFPLLIAIFAFLKYRNMGKDS